MTGDSPDPDVTEALQLSIYTNKCHANVTS